MRIALIFFLLLIFACSIKTTSTSDFFDTKSFFNHEIELLTKQKSGVSKRFVFINNNDSIILLDSVNWQRELQVFIDLDLAKPSNQSAFIVSNTEANGLIEKSYKAIDSAQELQTVIITTDNKQNVKIIEALLTKNNSLYKASKHLRYVTDSGYSINGNQQLKLGNNNTYQVAATFINN